MVKKISGNEFKKAVENGVSVIDFSANWCGPCQMLAPVLEEVSEELKGKASFFNVDVDENPDLAREYGVMNIPFLLVLKDGEKKNVQVGFLPKEGILQFVEENL